jgi:hypothetical protein
MWKGISGLIGQIKTCEAIGATSAALAMSYICLDTMTFLSLPNDRETQRRADFVAWVDAYLKGHPEQVYQYQGLDVYGARCAMLHAFGSEVNFHNQFPNAKIFGYNDGGRHIYNPTIDPRLVLIGTASFFDDVIKAVVAFMAVCQQNEDLRESVERRLPKVLATFPIMQ